MKRRGFIKKTALGAAGITAVSPAVMQLISSCQPKYRHIELAVLGCCKKGVELLVASLPKMEDVKIKTVFDFDSIRMKESCQTIENALGYRPEPALDMASVFNDKGTKGLFVFLPEHWRAPATIRACKADKDVYVAALPAHSLTEGKQMAETASKTRRIVQCGFTLRSAPAVASARQYISEGKLGQVVYVKIISLQKSKTNMVAEAASLPDGFDWNQWLGPMPERTYHPEIYSRQSPDGWTFFRDFTAGRLSEAGKAIDLARFVTGNDRHPSSVSGYEKIYSPSVEQKMPDRQIITWNYEHYFMTCNAGEAYGYLNPGPGSAAEEKNISPWLLQGNRVEIYGTEALMYLDSGTGSWQVQGKDGEILAMESETDNGTRHVVDFIESMRNRKQPAGNIQEGHLSAALAHLGNIACQTGNRQLAFDIKSETFINDEKANALLVPNYRKEFTVV